MTFEIRNGRGSTNIKGSRDIRMPVPAAAFTLLEVIVACGIFFLVGFAILDMVMGSLAAAKALQNRDPDPGLVAAALTLTNRLEEGVVSGTFEDIAPGLYPGWRWEAHVEEAHSNSLFRADIVVFNEGAKQKAGPSTISILMYRPGSPPGSRFGTGAAGGGR